MSEFSNDFERTLLKFKSEPWFKFMTEREQLLAERYLELAYLQGNEAALTKIEISETEKEGA